MFITNKLISFRANNNIIIMSNKLTVMFRLSTRYDIDDLDNFEQFNPESSDRALLDGIFTCNQSVKDMQRISIILPDGEIAGMAVCTLTQLEIHAENNRDSFQATAVLHIDYLYIRHDLRRKGIARQLIEHLKSMKYMHMVCEPFTDEAERFFNAMGFVDNGAGQLTLIQ